MLFFHNFDYGVVRLIFMFKDKIYFNGVTFYRDSGDNDIQFDYQNSDDGWAVCAVCTEIERKTVTKKIWCKIGEDIEYC